MRCTKSAVSEMRPARLLFVAALTVATAAFSPSTRADAADEPIKAEMKTNMGTIVLELYPDKAPETVANFVKYAKEGFYEGTIFHRVMSDFMIQGGGLDQNLREKPTREPVKNEGNNGLRNDPYTIAMARTRDPHSATSQFFINVAENSNKLDAGKTLDGWGYTVFGKVIEGKEVVDKIKQIPTRPRGVVHQNVPVEPVIIESVKIVEK